MNIKVSINNIMNIKVKNESITMKEKYRNVKLHYLQKAHLQLSPAQFLTSILNWSRLIEF